MRRYLVVGVAAVAACAPHDGIVKQVDGMKGQPIQAAVAKFGRPTSQRLIVDEMAYIWTTGYEPGTAPCTLRVFTKDSLITGSDIEGSPRACRQFAD